MTQCDRDDIVVTSRHACTILFTYLSKIALEIFNVSLALKLVKVGAILLTGV